MELQHERDGGMIPQGIRWGVSQTPDPIGCDQMSMGKPNEPLATFLSFVLNHQFLPEVG